MANDNGNGQNLSGRMIEDRFGNRQYTLDALREKATQQFLDEISGRADILQELNTPAKKRDAIAEAVDYVLAVQYVTVTSVEKLWLVDRIYRDIFRLGPLDTLLSDPTVTEISITGPTEVAARRGFGELERWSGEFEDSDHLNLLIATALTPFGIDTSNPTLETAIQLGGRALRFSLMGPPIMPFYNGLIRLHPAAPLTLAALAIPTIARDLLQKIIAGGHGLLIVGEGGMGKTTLLSHLLGYAQTNSALVQRGHEIHPSRIPATMTDYTEMPKTEHPTAVFERRLHEALNQKPTAVFVDEIQGDEGGSFWRLLTSGVQCVVTFRGKTNAARIHSALSMAIRKVHPILDQPDIDAALQRALPFVLIVSQVTPHTIPRIVQLGQWVADGKSFEALIEWDGEEPHRTDVIPCRNL
ncbi:MAG: Flp pilus assembly complex ATPase component TadA [Anaerolineales bacterium]|nr:Flp pilus assembly complex ATPase component TadA [Anaerolineales bacterium]